MGAYELFFWFEYKRDYESKWIPDPRHSIPDHKPNDDKLNDNTTNEFLTNRSWPMIYDRYMTIGSFEQFVGRGEGRQELIDIGWLERNFNTKSPNDNWPIDRQVKIAINNEPFCETHFCFDSDKLYRFLSIVYGERVVVEDLDWDVNKPIVLEDDDAYYFNCPFSNLPYLIDHPIMYVKLLKLKCDKICPDLLPALLKKELELHLGGSTSVLGKIVIDYVDVELCVRCFVQIVH